MHASQTNADKACTRKPRTLLLPARNNNQQQHTISFFCLAMPNMQLTTKKWGNADRAALARLVHDRDMNINDLSYDNINAVGREHFCHCKKKIFCRIFNDFAATFDLKAEYSRAKKRGKVRRCIFHCFIYAPGIAPPYPHGHQNCQRLTCIFVAVNFIVGHNYKLKTML
jgi:hypothetical protein